MTRAALGWLAAAVVLRIAANLVVRHLGFVAISDDDYARIVIAQQFAHAPTWDPSGTSWLPFPFWLTGSVLAGVGLSLEVAHGLAWVTSLLCVPAVYLAASWCGQAPRWAGFTACAFAVFPQAVWLDLATVPEGYAAVLATLALASCNRALIGERLVGIVCITMASLSRYELWPVAVVVALAQQLTPPAGTRRNGATPRLLTLMSLLGPTGWMLHGTLNHHDPLFFVTRIASYRTLVGQAPDRWLDILTNYPAALLNAAPEFTALCLLTLSIVALSHARGQTPLHWDWRGVRYPLLGALAVFVFLLWGDAKNGAPTHHPERALALCWLSLLLAVGTALKQLPVPSSKVLTLVVLALVPLLGLGLQRTNEQNFVNRASEIAVGQTFAHRLNDAHRLLIETHGYGHLAVAAASGRPWNVVGFNPEDPRQKSTLWATPAALSAFLNQERVRWLITPAHRRELGAQVATVVGNSPLGVELEVQ